MSTRRWTIAVMLAAVGGLILWDIIVATNSTSGDTISEIILDFAWDWHTLPLALGVICGHLIWPAEKLLLQGRDKIFALSCVGALALALDAMLAVQFFPLWPFLFGLIIGRIFWPQRLKK